MTVDSDLINNIKTKRKYALQFCSSELFLISTDFIPGGS